MSLINNMLKDLENREATVPIAPPFALTRSHTTLWDKFKSRYFISIVISSLLSVLVLMYFKNHSSPTTQMLPESVQTTSATTESAENKSWIQPNTINGITIDVKDNKTELTILLNHPPLYRIETDHKQRHIRFVLDNTELQTELMPVNYLNTGIESITDQHYAGKTELLITLSKGANLNSVNVSKSDHSSNLIITVNNHSNIAVDNESEPSLNSNIKAPAMHNMLNQQYQVALVAADEGRYQLAIQRLSSILKADPAFKDARVTLSALLLDQGMLQQAKHTVDEGLNDNPDFIPLIELKARILASTGKNKEALTVLHSASPSITENPEYHAFIAALHEQNNNHSLAIKIYTKLLELNPHNGNWWFGLGVALDKSGQDNSAIDAYHRAANEGHLNSESFAYMESRLQKLQEALDDKQ